MNKKRAPWRQDPARASQKAATGSEPLAVESLPRQETLWGLLEGL